MRSTVKNLKNIKDLLDLDLKDLGTGKIKIKDLELLERTGGAARAYIFDGIINQNQNTHILTIFPDERQSEEFVLNMRSLYDNLNLNIFMLKELPLIKNSENFNDDYNNANMPLLLERGETIKKYRNSENAFLAATPGALMTPCASTTDKFILKTGNEYKREDIITWLDDNGFKRVDLVWSPGQYAPRGFILDIFDPAYAMPRRLEFFDNELENIAAFKPSTQRTIKPITETKKNINALEVHSIISSNSQNFMPFDILDKNTLVVIFEPHKAAAQAESFYWLFNELAEPLRLSATSPIIGGKKGEMSMKSTGRADIEGKIINSWNEILFRLLKFNTLRISGNINLINPSYEFAISDIPAFRGNFDAVINFCHELNAQGYKINIYTTNPRIIENKNELFGLDNKKLNLNIINAALTSGFLDKISRQAFISDRELSGITDYESALGDLSAGMRTPIEWREQLTSGQLVIHEDYGVGIFRGIETTNIMGSTVDAVVLEFAENQRLLVPVLQSHKITPLAEHESENTQSELGNLRGSRWRKKMERDRERAKEEAKILIEIFAKRELERRTPLEPTGDLYNQFVKAFPYTETSDQIKAIGEIMNDLSSPFPMDRLLVGDVGFGKTEVALRAAFRAVTSGYQVCVLVPTTILAQQHYATFQARLAGFPVTVGLLSRFVSKKNLERTLLNAEDGKVDIVIGTHKLLQKGVKFKKLGLLIIDEEHRFGVMHKEGLKRIYGSVDILSLSATPIPRTLAMSLRGLRSISILSTPPEDRLPVTTFAGPWQTSLMRKAVAYELNRGGQVYFLANRISRMNEHKKMLETFFPDSNIQIAHGQMPERELENTMLDFYSGKIDILVATTIIESGLDVGRANTIIIDDAQELGLAQMYQLRGRVGRRGENAFAYFFYPANKSALKRETVDRLEAISTMTDLGSGYAIAERDLFIRGSGDIGGTEQHGSGRLGGFHIFYKLLEQELDKLRGVNNIKLTEIKFDRGGSIPEKYIPQEAVRVTMSRKILQAKGLDELNAIISEMQDRFGKIPDDTRLLIAITAIRNFGHNFNIESVVINKNNISVQWNFSQSGGGDADKSIPSKLKKLSGWTVIGRYAKGPGGLLGAETLFKVMNEIY